MKLSIGRVSTSASMLLLVGALVGCGQGDVVEAADEPDMVATVSLFDGGAPTQIALGADGDGAVVAGLVEGDLVTATCDSDAACEPTPGPKLAGTYGISLGLAGSGGSVDLVHALTCADAIDPCPAGQLVLEVFDAQDGYSNVANIDLTEFEVVASESVVRAVVLGPGTAVLSIADGASMTTTLFRVSTEDGLVTSEKVDGGVVAMAPSSDGSVVMATKKVARFSVIGGGQDDRPTGSPPPMPSAPAELPGSGGSSEVFESGEGTGVPPADMKILRLGPSDHLEEVRTLPKGSDDVGFIATEAGLGLIHTGSDQVVDAETDEPFGEVPPSRPAPESLTITAEFCSGSVPGAVLADFTQRLAAPQSTAMWFTFPSEGRFVSKSLERDGMVIPEAGCAVGGRLFLLVKTVPGVESTPASSDEGDHGSKLELVIL